MRLVVVEQNKLAVYEGSKQIAVFHDESPDLEVATDPIWIERLRIADHTLD